MLQQTQVATVIPYYERWMRELPTIEALAKAREEKILKLWEGLGYYSRARNLHRAAREIQANRAGAFPTEFEQVLALPGVGRYTAGAICSIAFNQPTPILDGNVARVLARLFLLPGDPRKAKISGKFWEKAEALVRCVHELGQTEKLAKNRPRACSSLNQSLMELGALICTPAKPLCVKCPVASLCRAHNDGLVDRFPQRASRPTTVKRREVVFVVRRSGRILLRRRPTGAVNAGFFELPAVELSPKVPTAAAAARKLGLKLSGKGPLCRVQHTITRFRIHVEACEAAVLETRGKSQTEESARSVIRNGTPKGCEWRSLRSLGTLPLASITRKVLRGAALYRHDAA